MAGETKKTATESTAVEAKTEKRLIVEREKFTAKDGREMWGYAVHGKGPNGRETRLISMRTTKAVLRFWI